VAYKQSIGRFYVRPVLSADYLDMHFGAYNETGGGPGFDLAVDSQTDSRLTGTAELALGRSWGQEAWLQSEVRLGVREVLENGMGDTTAAFDGGSLFSMTPDDDSGGWATIGFSLRAGSPSSYFALEGDGDFRNGEQRYDVRIAGRTIF
jgi:Autotransporter beta-domain